MHFFEAEEHREVAKVIPTELGPERIVEQIDDVPVPQVVEDLLEAVEITPQEHISERILEQFVETISQLQEETLEVVQSIHHNAFQSAWAWRLIPLSASRSVFRSSMCQCHRLWKRPPRPPVPQFREGIVEVFELIPPERMSERIVEQAADPPLLQILTETVEVVKIILQERISERTSEQIADVPVPQILKEIVEVVKITLQERILERTCEHIVDVPPPQIVKEIAEVVKILPLPPPPPPPRNASRSVHRLMRQCHRLWKSLSRSLNAPVPQVVEDLLERSRSLPRSASRSVHRSSMRQCRRYWRSLSHFRLSPQDTSQRARTRGPWSVHRLMRLFWRLAVLFF